MPARRTPARDSGGVGPAATAAGSAVPLSSRRLAPRPSSANAGAASAGISQNQSIDPCRNQYVNTVRHTPMTPPPTTSSRLRRRRLIPLRPQPK